VSTFLLMISFLRLRRALLRSSVHGQLRIMFPMVALLTEFRAAKKVFDQEKANLLAEGVAVADDIQVGIMIEIPAAAMLADQFAKEQNLEIVDPIYFYTQQRWDSLKKTQAKKHGTVGCVALDKHGNLAAGTSTGGLTNKQWGRIGDSPIIGAGTYANNQTCAVSGTGQGEYFIRGNVAYDISAMMEYENVSVGKAARKVIGKLSDLGAEGGVIAMDSNGEISMPFNTAGMYRGFRKAGESSKIFI